MWLLRLCSVRYSDSSACAGLRGRPRRGGASDAVGVSSACNERYVMSERPPMRTISMRFSLASPQSFVSPSPESFFAVRNVTASGVSSLSVSSKAGLLASPPLNTSGTCSRSMTNSAKIRKLVSESFSEFQRVDRRRRSLGNAPPDALLCSHASRCLEPYPPEPN